MYYSSFGLLSIAIHVLINLGNLKRPEGDSVTVVRRRYRHFLYGVLLYYISDSLWGFLYGSRLIALAYADTVLYFATMGITVFLWMRYIVSFLDHDSFFTGALEYSGAGIFLFQIGSLIINFFYPVVFWFDESSEYQPGKARYIMLGLQVIIFTATAIYTLIRSARVRGKDRLHHVAIGLSGVVMTLFIILQTKFPLLPFYAIGCLIATCIIHTFVEIDERIEHSREIGSIKKMAYKDSLTNVKNKTAYIESRVMLDQLIKDGSLKDFGLIVFDVNNLKKVNDTMGHEAGDRYIQKSCRLICNTFKHSPVFRIGGDEFIAFLEGEDYRERESLHAKFMETVERNSRSGGAVVSSGMDVFIPEADTGFDQVFERADRKMYERKKELKSRTENA